MNEFEVNFSIPNIFIEIGGKTRLVASMVLSTISVYVLVTLLPQLMPLWMAGATNSRV